MQQIRNLRQQGIQPARIEEIAHHIFAGWTQIGQYRRFLGDPIEVFQRHSDCGTSGHRHQMHNRIRGSTNRHQGGDGIIK